MSQALKHVTFALLQAVSAQYDEQRALLHANLATAAYCGYPKSISSLESWQCGPACDAVAGMSDVRQILTQDDNDAYAFVGKLSGECVLSFRGTSNLNGWMADLASLDLVDLTARGVACSYNGNKCQVGSGFMDNYDSVSAHIKGNLSAIGCRPGTGMTVVGHSLGAAEAAIAMYDLFNQGYNIKQTYTFGQPRVGDQWFAKAFEKDLGASIQYRVTHYRDPIPHLPVENIILPGKVGFTHTSQEVYYPEKYVPGASTLCDGSGEDRTCADSYDDVPAMTIACAAGGASECDHLTYFMPTKQTHMDGSSCTDGSVLSV